MKINIDGSRITPFIIGWICASVFYEQKPYWLLLFIPMLWALEFVENKYFKKDEK